MALLPILCYPDPKLHKVAKPVPQVDARMKNLVADMLEWWDYGFTEKVTKRNH